MSDSGERIDGLDRHADRVRPELTARYRALAELPDGTLGRGYYEFITGNEFAFPGELGHGPELIAQHMPACLEALQRGAAMNLDLSGPWDF